MSEKISNDLKELSPEQVEQVSGGFGGTGSRTLAAQDMYGNTMSIEEWMDRNADLNFGSDANTRPHDFYEEYYDGDKPDTRFP